MLKTAINITVLSLVLALPAHAFGLKQLDNLDSKENSLKSLDSLSTMDALGSLGSMDGLSALADNPLVSALTEQTDSGVEQSAMGSGLLLAMAGSSLSDAQGSELSSLVPGYSDLTTLIPAGSSISDMSSVLKVADTLGIDATTMMKYAPIVLKYLSNQGASSQLTDSLGSLWDLAN